MFTRWQSKRYCRTALSDLNNRILHVAFDADNVTWSTEAAAADMSVMSGMEVKWIYIVYLSSG